MNSAYKRTKAFFFSTTLFLTVLFIIGCFVVSIKNLCSTFQRYDMPINRVNTNDKKVALTFDVAWGSENINEILNILDKHNAKATFFLVGSWVDDNKDLVELINEKGHEIGNHSNTHPSMKNMSDEEILNEIEITSEKISNITGKKTYLFRPPFGEVNEEVMQICELLDYKSIKWDVDSQDWKGIDSVHIIERVSKGVQPGSIVLFHANCNNIEEYLDSILNQLESKGYKMVNLSDLIYKENYKVNSSGVQREVINN